MRANVVNWITPGFRTIRDYCLGGLMFAVNWFYCMLYPNWKRVLRTPNQWLYIFELNLSLLCKKIRDFFYIYKWNSRGNRTMLIIHICPEMYTHTKRMFERGTSMWWFKGCFNKMIIDKLFMLGLLNYFENLWNWMLLLLDIISIQIYNNICFKRIS